MKPLHAGLVLVPLSLWACTFIHDTRGSGGGGAVAPVDGQAFVGVTVLRHRMLDSLLREYVGPEGVAYTALSQWPEDDFALTQYLSMMGAIDPADLVSREEKLAFYINLYNATVLRGVVVEGTADPAFRVDRQGFVFFDDGRVTLDGRVVSLNTLEHLILRGDQDHSSASQVAELDRTWAQELYEDLWQGGPPDPRMHFLLNCASRSCPPLQAMALTAESYEATADAATAAFVNDPARGAGPDGISLIFSWFADDFHHAGYGSAGEFISGYRSLDDVQLEAELPYDWALNSWERP